MKAYHNGKFLDLYLENINEEYEWLKDKLTWHSKDGVESGTLLFGLTHNKYRTYAGLANILKQEAPFNVELLNLPIYDIKRHEIPLDILSGIELYDFQVSTIQKALIKKGGIAEIATGGGKTPTFLAFLKYLLSHQKISKSLIVVPSKPIAEQIHLKAVEKYGFKRDAIGVLHGERFEINSPITVAVINSLHHNIKSYIETQNYSKGLDTTDKKVYSLISKCDSLIFDECHHVKADSYSRIALLAQQSQYNLYFSGSPFQNPDDPLNNYGDSVVKGIAGDNLCYVPTDYLIQRGILAQPYVLFKSIPGVVPTHPINYKRLYEREIVKNYVRNKHIVDYTYKFAKLDFPTLIIVNRKEHAFKLIEQMRELSPVIYFGGGECHHYDNMGNLDTFYTNMELFSEQFEKGKWKVIIATQVFDEGVDLPNIKALIIAAAGRSRIAVLQRLGRALRKKLFGENAVYIVDFRDRTHVYLFSQSKKREEYYVKQGCILMNNQYEFYNRAYLDGMKTKEEMK